VIRADHPLLDGQQLAVQALAAISGANSALQANKDRLARSLFALGAESSRCTKFSG
jgi:hypothetical protein